MRVSTRKRKLIQPGLKEGLLQKNRELIDYFKTTTLDFIKSNKTKKLPDEIVTQVIVYCSDLQNLIEYVSKKRGASKTHLKFGIDGGQGSLKICMTIQSDSLEGTSDIEISKPKRQKYKDEVNSKKFKENGVKKLFVLALAPNIQENYTNVLKLWNLLNINTIIDNNNVSIPTDFFCLVLCRIHVLIRALGATAIKIL